MPRLPVQLSNFGGAFAGVNGYYDLQLTWSDIVRAAVTTGYPNLAAATMPFTFHRTWAVLFRASIVLAYLDAPTGDRIQRSDDYNRVDRSEKGAISYYLGLFGAKLGAELLLRTPWLLHYDAYHRLAHGVAPISRRPDMIGQATTGEWIAVEAKGRTNGWTNDLLASAKAQAQSLDEIVHPGGAAEPIDANVASITFFDGEGWNLLMDDPPATPRPLRLTSTRSELYTTYYAPVLSYLTAALEQDAAESVEIRGVGFKVAHDPDLDIFIGVANAVIETAGADIGVIPSALAELVEPRDDMNVRAMQLAGDDTGTRWSSGADGVIVRLGDRWD